MKLGWKTAGRATRNADQSPARYQEDLELAARCARDPKAWQQLFRAHAPQVFALARRLLGNRPEVEDVVQEVFSQIVTSIGSYRGEAALSSWMYRITVRCALLHMKQSRRRVGTVRLELVNPAAEDRVANPERSFHRNRTVRRVRAALDRVSPRRRAVFLLHEVEGFTLPETAALLGMSVTAAKKCVWRARRDIDRLVRKDPSLADELDGGRHE